MHELSVMEDVLQVSLDCARQNDADRITKITVHAGALANIIPKWAGIFFKMISEGTLAEGAELEFVTLPATVLCRDCGEESEIETQPPVFRCGCCGSEDVRLVSGREFRVESIEVE